MKRLLVLIFFIFLLFFLLPKTASADVLSWDNFNDGNTNDGVPLDWEEHLGTQGYWSVQNGEYIGSVVKIGGDIPTYSIAGDSNWNNYRFNVRIKGDQGVDKLVLFRYHSLNETYAIKLISSWWDWYGDKIALLKNNLITWTASATFVNSQGVWYDLLIEVVENRIKVYMNHSSVPIIDYIDETNPNLTGKIGLLVWPGFYNGYGSVTINRFDNVLVCDFEGLCEMPITTPTPPTTPIPTPTPTPLQPLILIPGMGASWNHEAMILRQERQPEDWHMTPGVKVYDGLIQTFQNAGYVLGENLFVFNYDWRKPVKEISNDLKDYIERLPILQTGKIDLVGHSLGGLVARTYVQNNPENQVDQLVTIGSPHQGIVKFYYLWEGANLSKALSAWQRIGIGILLQFNKKFYESKIEAIRHTSPSIKDLLPTFSYLKNNEDSEIPLSSLTERNWWLETLNLPPFPNYLLSHFNSFAGTKGDTLRWLKVEKRDRLAELLNLWVDGKPTNNEYALGDDTILIESASLPGVNATKTAYLNHGELVETENGQEQIMQILNLHPATITAFPKIDYIPSLVFQIASPANITIFDQNWNKVSEENVKLAFVPNAQSGSYFVKVYPEETGGEYRLLIGRMTQNGDVWNEISGEIKTGYKQHQINFNLQPQVIQLELFYLSRARLATAWETAELKEKPASTGLAAQLKNKMHEVEQIISLFLEGRDDSTERKIKQAILSLNKFKDHLQDWSVFQQLNNEDQEKILDLIREAEDYLVQAYELE